MFKNIAIGTLQVMSVLAVTMSLVSCDAPPPSGTDGYNFHGKQYEKNEVTIKIVTYQSRKDLNIAAEKLGVKDPDLAAFSVLRPPFDKCTIHMVDPTVKYEPEFSGHEFLHCVYGQFHLNNNSR